MAARSPNIKLRKVLNREHLKCPLSAPAKPSKPWMPLISHKNGDPQTKTGACSKVGSTPVAKTRQVAAKYMTTPRNKVCHPNPSSFRSVQNPRKTTVDVGKSRTVAKALVFRSPKKAVVVKKSVELHTPLMKICEGMKRLGVTSQKKTLKGSVSKTKKLVTVESSRRRLNVCESDKKSKDLVTLKSAKTHNKQVVDVKPSDGSTTEFSKKEDETSETSNLHDLRGEMKDLSNVEDKENMVIVEDHLNEVDVGFGSEQMDDGKENALNPQDNNRYNVGYVCFHFLANMHI